MKKYKAIIIGAGSIGAMKPDKYDYPGGENILTIAHAMSDNPNIELAGIIEHSPEQLKKACEKWKCDGFKSIEDYKDVKGKADIIAVCVPTTAHAPVLVDALSLNPKLIMGEKPFCTDSKEASKIIDMYNELDIPIAMDYIRRYEPCHFSFALDMSRGIFGKVFHCKVTYTRGLIHEACHALDLMGWWFGKYEYGEIYCAQEGIVDRDKDDPAIGAYFAFEKCDNVTFHPVDGRKYSIFEIDIWTECGRFVFADHGKIMDHYPIVPEPTYGDYDTLSCNPLKIQRKGTELTKALSYYAKNCVDYLDGTFDLICTAEDALKVHKIYRHLGIGK
jgi:predicted dehydrogenase